MSKEPALPATNDLRGSRREIFAWAMYDWANSAYSTISITVLAVYVKTDVLPGKGGILLLGPGLGVTMFVAALLSPILGAVADAHASKRRWLAGTALTGAAAVSLMFFTTPDLAWLLVLLYLMANLGMELSQGFYNGFLPEIASDENMGRVSAWGYALGYLGGGLALALILVMFQWGDLVGLPDDPIFRKRLGLLFTGLWWAGFTIPCLMVLRDRVQPATRAPGLLTAARKALGEVRRTLVNIRHYRMLALFLVGFLIYNDGVSTVITQSSQFAIEKFKMETTELGLIILMVQFIALPGAMLVGALADRIGQKPMLLVCLGVWTLLLALAFFISEKWQFWCMAAVAGLVLGGTQSVSRAIMGLMTPERHSAEFFGFFNLSSKAASVFGPVFFGFMLAYTGNPNYAITSLLVFIVVGAAIVLPLNVAEGQRHARQLKEEAEG
ncbi:MAG: MFS transporter [Pirellulales bacterium]